MSRRSKNTNNGIVIIIIFILIAIAGLLKFITDNWNIFRIIFLILISIIIIALIVLILYKINKKKKGLYKNDSKTINNLYETKIQNENLSDKEAAKLYESKDSLISQGERFFYNFFTELLSDNYIIQPQVNLASIINKLGMYKYQNELYRNIDFGIFTKESYSLVLLIEINDKTHNSNNRRSRDNKVKDICREANIPLITFWNSMPNKREYIISKLSEYLTINNVD